MVELIDHGMPARLDPERRARRPGRRARAAGARHQQRALRRPRRSTSSPPRSPPCAPGAASTSSTAGCPPAGRRSCARGPRCRHAFARYPGGGRAHGRRSPTSSPSRCGGPSPRCRAEVPDGHTPMSWLRQLVWEAPCRRNGTQSRARRRRTSGCEQELDVIEQKDFPGYFLIVHDIVRVRAEPRHPLPGPGLGRQLGGLLPARHHRGRLDRSTSCRSSGSSSSTRDEEPDIDVDFDSDRREEIIQWVYEKYGATGTPPRSRTSSSTGRRTPCATWRRRSGTRPASRTPGRSRWSVGRRSRPRPSTTSPTQVIELATELLKVPAASRHPLRRHGADRPARRRGGADRARPHGEPHGHPVGQGRLRPGWGW